MGEFGYIYVFFIAIFVSLAMIVIINMREKKTALVEEKEDFFTAFYNRKKQMLEVNMPSLDIKTYMIITGTTPVVLGLILWQLFPNKTFATIISVFTVFLPDFVIRLIVEKKRKRYEEHYVRALKAMATSMRSGMSVQIAIKEVIANPFVSADIQEAFRQIDSDITVGISIQDAFYAFAEKADNDDARDVASAIAMQNEIGGSEAKVIDSIAINIENRLMTRKKIRSVFASTDYTVNAFDVMPFLAIVIMYIGMPDYVEPIFEDPLTALMAIALLAFTLIGSINIRKKIAQAKGER